MHILKAGTLLAIPTALKLISGLVILKIISLQFGAEGLGKFGQFMSLMAMIATLAAGGICTGIVKYVAEFKQDKEKLREHIQSASAFSFTSSIAISCAVFGLSEWISIQLFGSISYSLEIKVLSLAQLFISASCFIIAVINGQQKLQAYAAINTSGILLGIIGLYVLTQKLNFTGALYGLMWLYSCPIIGAIYWLFRQNMIPTSNFIPKWRPNTIHKFSQFATMNLVTVLTMQLSQIVIRNIIENKAGWEAAGYWQGISKFSDAYLQFFTIVLANYYMPRISSQSNKSKIISEALSTIKITAILLLISSAAIFLLKGEIIRIVFSEEFSSMELLFKWQIPGDALRLVSYIIGFIAVAKAATKLYILAELIQASLLITLIYVFTSNYGLEGASMGYLLTYAVYATISIIGLLIYRKTG